MVYKHKHMNTLLFAQRTWSLLARRLARTNADAPLLSTTRTSAWPCSSKHFTVAKRPRSAATMSAVVPSSAWAPLNNNNRLLKVRAVGR